MHLGDVDSGLFLGLVRLRRIHSSYSSRAREEPPFITTALHMKEFYLKNGQNLLKAVA